MSKNNRGTRGRGAARGSPGPAVVNATWDLTTNEFQVSPSVPQPPVLPSRSKFDFSSNNHDVNEWALNASSGWNAAPATTNQPWVQPSAYQEIGHRFSNKDKDIVTFRLNPDIVDDDSSVFTKVVNYEDFRNESIVPDREDILKPEEPEPANDPDDIWAAPPQRKRFGVIPHLPINQVRGSYSSVDEYLYTHFELMRHDILIPLQRAVKSYREFVDRRNYTPFEDFNGTASNLPRDFRLYEKVHLNALVFGSRQVLHRISFRVPHYVRKVSWAQSKRLLEGSLVLLSKDDFETDIKVATVVQRGEVPMKANRFEYFIDIFLEKDNDDMPLGFGDPSSMQQDTYVMIEAVDGYFEAYRHVLTCLQNIDPETLPFTQNFVDVSQEVRIPHYAAVKRFYDIDLTPGSRKVRTPKPVDIANGIWPEYQTSMDATQMDALRTILSHDVAIVQGPPGTGKTFVGTYAMGVLLRNFDESFGPIVCICQTNHALDQFLEHILQHDSRIVRIGGRSKSDLLKEHILYEICKNYPRGPRGIGRLYRQRDAVMKAIKQMIIDIYEEPCVPLDYLYKIKALRPRQLDSLKRLGEREKARKQQQAPNSAAAAAEDSDDEWVITSEVPKAPSRARNDTWDAGNPNHAVAAEAPPVNAVEVWLRDAIEYVDPSGILSSYTEDMKEQLLETQKGQIFDDDEDEKELMDEDEQRDIIQDYRDDAYLSNPLNKNPYINIGRAYRNPNNELRNDNPSLMSTTRADRKVLNYEKQDNLRQPKKLSFFDDDDDAENEFFDEEPQHHVLERWLKDDDVTMWPLAVRLKAHKKWATQRHNELNRQLQALMQQYENYTKQIRKINAQHHAAICRKHRVIGLTTTGASKYHDLLQEIKPRVLVVEEAAEMLESHIVAALTPSLQHLILIGDHQQLRPSTAVHELSEYHHLSVSLFERLVLNDIPFTRLSHQRRMHPEIRTLIDPIYSNPRLQDHKAVFGLPPVRGVSERIFFLSHNEAESHMDDTASKSNEHEAEMAAKLATYFMLQGYEPEMITIITMYAGQRSKIRKCLRDERRSDLDTSLVHVSSVDGYQGEENKIIILSLVRSNSAGQIGFLKVSNRVCVSLSRAKHGMYILGNAHLLCEKSDLWNEIIANLEDQPLPKIGTKLELSCQKHGRKTEVQWPVDFTAVEEGGCSLPCSELLACGHKCPKRCHPYSHEDVRCQEVCRRPLPGCGHPCPNLCIQPCGPCKQTVRMRLNCGHDVEGECSKMRQAPRCPLCSGGL
ncbi:P-loop containing nucleoside triphosphate hydrolase protein [Radiomyces spectabilis]|uniref:P-loop containing nucleoside triphosphate hydrolase protein n=1 Tax=Radiomyces spectabilis TaxID=64574 RepID=UPI00221F5BE9|nr:P-loop containing nucleoside triphosphate hydrolase protein [Radiomyces spectabilis]KAI8367542.1 P-loop containing nucleoside triphosphate hydrolase protein [Radiomyces spectabilis]